MKRFFTVLFLTLIFSAVLSAATPPIAVVYQNGAAYIKVTPRSGANMWLRINEEAERVYIFENNEMRLINPETDEIRLSTLLIGETRPIDGIEYKLVSQGETGPGLYIGVNNSTLYEIDGKAGSKPVPSKTNWVEKLKEIGFGEVHKKLLEYSGTHQLRYPTYISIDRKYPSRQEYTTIYSLYSDGFQVITTGSNVRLYSSEDPIVQRSYERYLIRGGASGTGGHASQTYDFDAASGEMIAAKLTKVAWTKDMVVKQMGYELSLVRIPADIELLDSGFLDKAIEFGLTAEVETIVKSLLALDDQIPRTKIALSNLTGMKEKAGYFSTMKFSVDDYVTMPPSELLKGDNIKNLLKNDLKTILEHKDTRDAGMVIANSLYTILTKAQRVNDLDDLKKIAYETRTSFMADIIEGGKEHARKVISQNFEGREGKLRVQDFLGVMGEVYREVIIADAEQKITDGTFTRGDFFALYMLQAALNYTLSNYKELGLSNELTPLDITKGSFSLMNFGYRIDNIKSRVESGNIKVADLDISKDAKEFFARAVEYGKDAAYASTRPRAY
ncbi:MAG: hypothetical protein V1647_03955 [Pseudomonadota bacterium]